MSKVLLVVDMSDEDYQLLEKYTKQKMIVDIGFNHDNMFGWTFMRRDVKLKPMPERKYVFQGMKGYTRMVNECKGWNDCIDEIIGEEQ